MHYKREKSYTTKMAYKRKMGKNYYFYKSVRTKEGKVKAVYIGKLPTSKTMQVALKKENVLKSTNEAIFLPVFENERINLAAAEVNDRKFALAALKSIEFKGKKGQAASIILPSQRTLILAGLGERQKFALNDLRTAFANAIKTASGINAKEIAASATIPLHDKPEAAKALVETAIMASYRFETYKSEKLPAKVSRIIISDVDEKSRKNVALAVNEGEVFGSLNTKARELVNTPAKIATPDYVARIAGKMARENEIKCTILDKKEIERKGMGGVLAVSEGSANEPKFVVLEYNGDHKSQRKTCLVGKGVCFDSGGVSLKNASGMETMKDDKSGAVAVLYTLEACAKLGIRKNVVGIFALVENMPSGTSYKPGDIIQTMSGKTIEVLNTDAEGRVILADALHYAATLNPEEIVDVATLTGAAIVALGTNVSAVMGNDDRLIDNLASAGSKVHERMWRLPLYADYFELVKSDFADVKNVTTNVGSNPAGSIAGGKFLETFVGKNKWAHIDIGGASWADSEADYRSRGATGVGVRLLTQFLLDY